MSGAYRPTALDPQNPASDTAIESQILWGKSGKERNARKTVEHGHIAINWVGFVWSLEGVGEHALVKAEAERIAAGEDIAFDRYMGAYGMEVLDRRSGESTVFVDNAGLYAIFHDANRVSVSFLELAEVSGKTADDLDVQGCLEFLMARCMYAGRTLLRDIRRIRPDEALLVGKGEVGRLAKPSLPTPASSKDIDFDVVMTALAKALQGYKVSLDLTGGLDSRLLFAALNAKGLDFEVALSGNKDFTEFEIAEDVARCAGKQLQRMIHEVKQVDPEDLDEMLEKADGQIDIFRYHRVSQFSEWRKERGMEVCVGGDFGEILRDLWWQQDLPFYGSSNIRLRRFLDYRGIGAGNAKLFKDLLGASLRPAAETLEDRLSRYLEKYRSKTNNDTYDSIYVNEIASGRTGPHAARSSMDVPRLFPYCDWPITNYARALNPYSRFFGIQQRRLITHYSPEIAACPTEKGFTASATAKSLLMEFVPFVFSRFKRYLRHLGVPIKQKPAAEMWPDDPNLLPFMRVTATKMGLDQVLHDAGVLRSDRKLEELPPATVSGFVTVALLLRRLKHGTSV